MGVGSVRLLRRERGWTLDALAERAGTTKSYLSKIERDQSTPSIAVAMKVADALQVDVAELFGEPEAARRLEITRAADRDPATALDPLESSPYLGLANRVAGKQMMPFVLFPPSTAEQGSFRDHVGDEFVIVLAGVVELSFPDRAERLGTGDSAYFRGGTAHRFRSLGTEQAQLLVVISAGDPRHDT